MIKLWDYWWQDNDKPMTTLTYQGGSRLLCNAHLSPYLDLLLPPPWHQVGKRVVEIIFPMICLCPLRTKCCANIKLCNYNFPLWFVVVQDEQSAVHQVYLSLYQPHVPSSPADYNRFEKLINLYLYQPQHKYVGLKFLYNIFCVCSLYPDWHDSRPRKLDSTVVRVDHAK